jgi:hypothetical protein
MSENDVSYEDEREFDKECDQSFKSKEEENQVLTIEAYERRVLDPYFRQLSRILTAMHCTLSLSCSDCKMNPKECCSNQKHPWRQTI